MKRSALSDARRRFSRLIAEVESGIPVQITRGGDPVALLVPAVTRKMHPGVDVVSNAFAELAILRQRAAAREDEGDGEAEPEDRH
jgi:prevent-host-death family protein